MEPISLIVAAIVAGLTAAATDVTKTTVKDTYDLFRSRLKKKVEGKEDAQEALAAVEKRPDSEARQAVLKEELAGLDVTNDEELLRLAQAVMEKVDEPGSQAGKYNIRISGGQGFVIGDHAKVEQHFGSKPVK
jgi:uncharacterized protein YmfQ (DUF2313 family)